MSENGLIVISDALVDSGRLETYQYPLRLDADVLRTSPGDVKGFIAPFWADTHSSTTFFKVSEFKYLVFNLIPFKFCYQLEEKRLC